MNPYKVDIDKLEESLEVKDDKEVLKIKLASEFLNIVEKMTSEEILKVTKLHKADLSRLRSMNIERFTIDRLVGVLTRLGYSTKLKVEAKKAS